MRPKCHIHFHCAICARLRGQRIGLATMRTGRRQGAGRRFFQTFRFARVTKMLHRGSRCPERQNGRSTLVRASSHLRECPYQPKHALRFSSKTSKVVRTTTMQNSGGNAQGFTRWSFYFSARSPGRNARGEPLCRASPVRHSTLSSAAGASSQVLQVWGPRAFSLAAPTTRAASPPAAPPVPLPAPPSRSAASDPPPALRPSTATR